MTVSTNNGLVNGEVHNLLMWVLGPGGGGGSPKGLVHNLLMQFFTLGSSKIEVFKTCFFDIVTTQMTIQAMQSMF